MSTSQASASYHHGNLRAAALAEGLRLLEQQSDGVVGLRAVAHRVGVSATALYRHFPDKDGFLRALAGEGLKKLAAAQREAHMAAGSEAEAFRATGITYVRFALAHPGLFRLMFSLLPAPEAPDMAHDDDPMELLLTNATALLPENSGEEVVRLAALRAWAMVHGLATLMLSGQIPPDDEAIEKLVDCPFADR